jgi:hypothetical protein
VPRARPANSGRCDEALAAGLERERMVRGARGQAPYLRNTREKSTDIARPAPDLTRESERGVPGPILTADVLLDDRDCSPTELTNNSRIIVRPHYSYRGDFLARGAD